ncbi:MAG: substrate-binding domain-containing protein [Bacteroidales bacterium]|nr:substrate-binding domain-containing protein [Bacteroidales bacterium]
MKSLLRSSLLTVFSVLSLLACSRKPEVFTIGVSQCSVDAWREAANNEIGQEALFYNNLNLVFKSVRDDSQQQIADIEQFIEDGVDLLIISPNESSALSPVVEKAYDAGIPVVLYDRKVDSDKYTAFIGGDNRQIGSIAGSYTLSIIDGRKRIALIRGTRGSTADTERYEGFVSVLDQQKISGAAIAVEAYANFTREDARKAMGEILSKTREEDPYDLVFAFNDEMAAGVYDAYVEAGMKKPFIMGIDALLAADGTGTIPYILDGMIDASFIYPTGGNAVISLAHRILMGEPFERENILSTEMVNRTNVRVYQTQVNQLAEKQRRAEELNTRIQAYSQRYERQQQLMYIILAFVVILGMVLILLAFTMRTRNRLVVRLNEQNAQIRKQVESLEAQKKQLIDLSEQLEETTQAKLNFFTNISHEFKTPLSLISGPIDDLIANKQMPANAEVPLDILKRNSSKLTRLITELLDFRTLESGNLAVNYSMGNLDTFLREILKMFADVIRRRNLHFEYEVDDSGYEIPFDPIKMEKVFTNLLSNAFNHVDKEGTIRIRLSSTPIESGRDINLSVFNSGSYIPPENIEKIFQRFYTLDAEQKGTGIGLALVTSLVDALGGVIQVDSEQATGTTFTVKIPLEKDLLTDARFNTKTYVPEFAKLKLATMGEEDVASGILDEMAREEGKPTVLVIEDNVDMRYYIRTILSSDYHVLLAKDGNIGTSKAFKLLPDIVLCDIMMPDMDGYEVCRQLKGNPSTKDIPIILLTACSLDEQRARGYESGAEAFMQKPFNVTTLKVRMRQLLQRKEQISSEIQGDWLIGRKAGTLSSAAATMLNRFREYVEEHIMENISLDEIAQHLGYSKSKLYRELKDVTEYSPIDLVNLVRLHKAVDLMTREQQNITEAAFNTGFSSPSYFSRTFLKYYYMRPKDYIKGKQSSHSSEESC